MLLENTHGEISISPTPIDAEQIDQIFDFLRHEVSQRLEQELADAHRQFYKTVQDLKHQHAKELEDLNRQRLSYIENGITLGQIFKQQYSVAQMVEAHMYSWRLILTPETVERVGLHDGIWHVKYGTSGFWGATYEPLYNPVWTQVLQFFMLEVPHRFVSCYTIVTNAEGDEKTITLMADDTLSLI